MVLKAIPASVIIEITICENHDVALMRAIYNNGITLIQMHSFVQKRHFISLSEVISHSSVPECASVPPLTG